MSKHALISKGVDSNSRFDGFCIPRLDENITSISPCHLFAQNRDNSLEISPLHVSVLNCFQNCNLSREGGNRALAVFHELLKRNANKNAVCPSSIVITNIGNFDVSKGGWQLKWRMFKSSNPAETTPAALTALSLTVILLIGLWKKQKKSQKRVARITLG